MSSRCSGAPAGQGLEAVPGAAARTHASGGRVALAAAGQAHAEVAGVGLVHARVGLVRASRAAVREQGAAGVQSIGRCYSTVFGDDGDECGRVGGGGGGDSCKQLLLGRWRLVLTRRGRGPGCRRCRWPSRQGRSRGRTACTCWLTGPGRSRRYRLWEQRWCRPRWW